LTKLRNKMLLRRALKNKPPRKKVYAVYLIDSGLVIEPK
jgi:hypothetical protein